MVSCFVSGLSFTLYYSKLPLRRTPLGKALGSPFGEVTVVTSTVAVKHVKFSQFGTKKLCPACRGIHLIQASVLRELTVYSLHSIIVQWDYFDVLLMELGEEECLMESANGDCKI